MRHVFSNSECVHVWAQRVQDEGRGSSIFFEKDVIYSYGHHFPMARHVNDTTVLYTTYRCRPTTASHLACVRQAINHKTVIRCREVKLPWDTEDQKRIHDANITHFVAEIAECRLKADRARELKCFRLQAYLGAVLNARRYVELFKIKGTLDTRARRAIYGPNTGDIENEITAAHDYVKPGDTPEQAEKRRQARERRAELKLARELAAIEEHRLQQNERLKQWTGRDVEYQDGVAYLRLNSDKTRIETSMHAQILVTHAPVLWRIITRCIETGQAYTEPIKIDYYTLREIDGQGNMRIGCHFIPYSELYEIAKQLHRAE